MRITIPQSRSRYTNTGKKAALPFKKSLDVFEIVSWEQHLTALIVPPATVRGERQKLVKDTD